MTISEIADLSTAVSGLAVTASLIYLALQVHQNTKHTRAFIHQGRSDRFITATPEEVKQRQFALICSAIVNSWEDTFTQHEDGLISEDQFASFRASVAFLVGHPGVRQFWQGWKTRRPDGLEKFKAFVDAQAKAQPHT
jgi:hypothetical protein